MIKVWCDKFSVSDPVARTSEIIAEYQVQGQVEIDLQQEGPCADHIGLYAMLDRICEQFGFDRSRITVHTANSEETHDQYCIVEQPRWHWATMRHVLARKGIRTSDFEHKQLDQYLLSCFYNIPSWDRLCLISRVKSTVKNSCLISCNGVLQGHEYNSYDLNQIIEFCPQELHNIVQFILSNPGPLPDHPNPGVGQKPTPDRQLDIIDYYNHIFVDLVGETYIHGLTFYPTEKTWRPVYTLTPFVISGPQGFVDNLRSRYGVRTFSQWWDESYDNYQNYQRIEKIYSVIEFLDSLSLSDRLTMYQEMLPTLRHNQQIIIKHNDQRRSK
jgi:hypothetical protein